jgi:hypothetical protein
VAAVSAALYPPHLVKTQAPSLYAACALSQHRVLSFLRECGVALHAAGSGSRTPTADERACLAMCEEELRRALPSHRAAHAADGVADVVRHATGAFLNAHHRQLLAACEPNDPRLQRHPISTDDAGTAAPKVSEAEPDASPTYMLAVVRPPKQVASKDSRTCL